MLKGEKIARLKPGDEVIIKAGYGDPRVEEDKRDVIVSVDGLSALTAAGISLKCHDSEGVKPTGKHYSKFELSPKAKKILEALP